MRPMRFMLGAAAICLLAAGALLAQGTPEEMKSTVDLTLGYQNLDQSGNIYRYEQYITRPSGFFLDQLRLITEAPDGLVIVGAQTPLEKSREIDASVYGIGNTPTSFKWRFSGNEFHPDSNVNNATRETNALALNIGVRPGLPFLNLSMVDQNLRSDKEIDYPNYGATDMSATLPLQIGPLQLKATALSGRFTDVTRDEPNIRSHGIGLTGSLSLGDRLLIGSEYSTLTVDTDTLGKGGDFSNTLLDANYLVSNALSLRGQYRLYNRDSPLTQNGYSKRISTTSMEMAFRPIRQASFRVGAEARRIDHLDLFASLTDKPSSDSYWVRAKFHPIRIVDLSARYYNRKLADQPRPGLYPQDAITSEVNLAVTPWANAGFTANWNSDRRKNPFVGTSFGLNQNVLAMWWAPNPRLSLSGDYTRQSWSTLSSVLTDWLTKTSIAGATASYAVNPRTSLEASYYRLSSSGNATSGRERDLSLGIRRQISRLASGFAGYERVTYEDLTDAGNNYSTNRVRVSLSTRL